MELFVCEYCAYTCWPRRTEGWAEQSSGAVINACCNKGSLQPCHIHTIIIRACIAVYDTAYMYVYLVYIRNVNGACCHCSLEDPTVLMLRNMREEVVKEDVSSLVSKFIYLYMYIHVHVYYTCIPCICIMHVTVHVL